MSDISYLVSSLASKVRSPIAHQVIFRTSQEYYLAQLAKNPNLSPELLDQLIRTNLHHWDVVKSLALRQTPLEDKQVTFLLNNHRSKFLLDELYTSLVPRASYQFQNKLLDGKVTTERAKLWLSNPSTLRAVQPKLLQKIIAPELLAHLIPNSRVSDAKILQSLALLEVDEAILSYYLWPLFDLRPQLVTPALALHNDYLNEALASCRHIFDQKVFEGLIVQAAALTARPKITDDSEAERFRGQKTLVAIAANPNASLTTSKSALKMRTMGADLTDYGSSRPKPTTWGHLSYKFGSGGYARVLKIGRLVKSEKKQVATATWEHLSKKELLALLQDRYLPAPACLIYPTLHEVAADDKSSTLGTRILRKPRYDTVPFNRVYSHHGSDMSPARIKELIENPLDDLGPEGWEIFISLAVDWPSFAPSLLETVKLLTSKAS